MGTQIIHGTSQLIPHILSRALILADARRPGGAACADLCGSPRLSGLRPFLSFLRRVGPKRPVRVQVEAAGGVEVRQWRGRCGMRCSTPKHATVVRTYAELWPRKDRAQEKVLIILVEPDEQTRNRCPECGQRADLWSMT